LHLIERGTELEHQADFDAVIASMDGSEGSAGLLDQATQLASRTGTTEAVDQIRGLWDQYLAVDRYLRDLEDAGEYKRAVRAAVGAEARVAAQLDRALEDEIDAARDRLDAAASSARSDVRWLAAVVLAATALAAALVVAGLWARMKEYR
jgi:hypothetical protein